MKTVKFKGQDQKILKSYYPNKRTALVLSTSSQFNEDSIVASVNLPESILPNNDHVFIKTWGENEGILKALEDAGAVESTGIEVPTGFVSATMVKLLV